MLRRYCAMSDCDRKALTAGLAAALTVIGGVWLGSHGLKHFDPAPVWYAIGSVLAAFAVGYRFTVWARSPPSRMYLRRGLQLLVRRGFKLQVPRFKPHTTASSRFSVSTVSSPALTIGHALASDFIAQNLIRRRSLYRWIMHLCLSGGCTLAFVITFPLVFGWVHFESFDNDAAMYRVILFGFNVDSFSVHSSKALVLFNALNISAVLVLIGLVMAAIRRMTNAGERAVQTFTEDILPLILIFVVAATGLMLTVSYKFMAGRGHSPMAVAHLISVIALLFYIPFGKLFLLFQP